MTLPRRMGRRLACQSARARQDVADFQDRPHRRGRAAREDLADAEQSHRQDDELDAVEQPHLAEIEARDAGLRIDADGAEEEPGDARRQPLQDRRADRGERRQAEHDEGEIFRRPEGERRARQRRRQQHEAEGAERSGDAGADGGDAERGAGAALQGHLVAVDAGHDGARLAGHADEHGGERAAVLRAVIDAGEHDDGGGRARAVGERQEQGDGGRRSDARQHPDHLAEQHAGEAHGEMRRRQRRRETLHQVEERPHLEARAARPGTARRARCGRSGSGPPPSRRRRGPNAAPAAVRRPRTGTGEAGTRRRRSRPRRCRSRRRSGRRG